MHDAPHGRDLIDVARQALLEEVAPGLTGRPRYVALMVANALGIVMRELETGEARAAAWARALSRHGDGADEPVAALARAIRAGTHDGDPDLYGALVETAAIAARTWKPDPGSG